MEKTTLLILIYLNIFSGLFNIVKCMHKEQFIIHLACATLSFTALILLIITYIKTK